MYRTIQLSSCVSVQGELVETLGNGEILVKDGKTIYRGRPVEFRDPVVPRSIGPDRKATTERPRHF
ncbi:MAG TPA: hypothetical protein PKA33_00475 [Amaricoccus sp.]|uniref:hypothetical protein n=1 Tax=Amaricoccus sp. TaxID=1872485 RepID=UPI002BD20CE3|nr:hypothetical protein [Amaricoccus sp.]HMQ92092.1 hypothetical protein [Amaricoccus sp.]HMR51001.1 hypothetical protein [Amaricoccus sp.]HMR59322.1 hypothetical protein [Amaricoccus sp.]HMT97820.1 hypothetical protein [Amaricoccus sp.]